jgi:hypothetical protein
MPAHSLPSPSAMSSSLLRSRQHTTLLALLWRIWTASQIDVYCSTCTCSLLLINRPPNPRIVVVDEKNLNYYHVFNTFLWSRNMRGGAGHFKWSRHTNRCCPSLRAGPSKPHTLRSASAALTAMSLSVTGEPVLCIAALCFAVGPAMAREALLPLDLFPVGDPATATPTLLTEAPVAATASLPSVLPAVPPAAWLAPTSAAFAAAPAVRSSEMENASAALLRPQSSEDSVTSNLQDPC